MQKYAFIISTAVRCKSGFFLVSNIADWNCYSTWLSMAKRQITHIICTIKCFFLDPKARQSLIKRLMHYYNQYQNTVSAAKLILKKSSITSGICSRDRVILHLCLCCLLQHLVLCRHFSKVLSRGSRWICIGQLACQKILHIWYKYSPSLSAYICMVLKSRAQFLSHFTRIIYSYLDAPTTCKALSKICKVLLVSWVSLCRSSQN